ncbi:hypothetical protein [Roseateles flavus]|uniref:Integrase n=1 Tax=Roseateles flavus TaxID=3149041 RepID=A0ABV0G8W3_9BURK
MRQTVDVVMPVPEAYSVIDPSMAMLTWPGYGRKFDLGKFAFFNRDTSNNKRIKHYFSPHSKTDIRDEFIRKVIKLASTFETVEALRPASVYSRLAGLEAFLDWADKNRYPVNLNSSYRMELLVERYFAHGISEVALGASRNNGMAQDQGSILSIFRGIFEDEQWGNRLRRLRHSKSDTQPTEVPPTTDLGVLYAACKQLFVGISNLILNPENFPHSITGPFGPDPESINVIFMADGRTSLKSNPHWNEVTGLPRTYAELRDSIGHKYKYPRETAHNIHSIHRRTQLVSSSVDHRPRRELAHTAAYCFGMILSQASGWNLQPLCDLEFDSELEGRISKAEVSRQLFRSIKFRANGNEVFIELPVSFIPLLRRFLQLRSHIVGEAKIRTLLIAQDRYLSPREITDTFQTRLFGKLATLGIELPRLFSRKLRAAKHDRLIRTESPKVTAEVMGQSLQTTLMAYSNGSAEAHREEMSAYLKGLERASTRQQAENEIATGHCGSRNSPTPISPSAPVQVACGTGVGCLFCMNFRPHADEKDIRKLLSCRKCLSLTLELSPTPTNDDGLTSLIKRIDDVLSTIENHMPSSEIERIRLDVYENGNLDPYWEGKLSQLIELGII